MPSSISARSPSDAADEIQYLGNVVLRAAAVREVDGIAGLGVDPLSARTMNVEQSVLAAPRWELHPTQGAAEGDVDGGGTCCHGGPSRWFVPDQKTRHPDARDA